MQIIGHTHLRIGSELEPELGGTLYTALVTALSQIEPFHYDYAISGIFGYKIPDNEGIGFFTIQNPHFRGFFLCEGLYGRGIPILGGIQTSRNIKLLFKGLEEVILTFDLVFNQIQMNLLFGTASQCNLEWGLREHI